MPFLALGLGLAATAQPVNALPPGYVGLPALPAAGQARVNLTGLDALGRRIVLVAKVP